MKTSTLASKSRRVLLATAAAFAAGRAAATVQSGQHQISVNVGAAVPTTNFDLTAVGGKNEVMAGSGAGFGGQYLYHVTPALGLGGELSSAAYGDKNHSVTSAVVTSSYKTWALEAVARYVLMPDQRINPYFIAGFGLGSVAAKASTKPAPGNVWTNTGTTESRTNFNGGSTGAAFSLGAGADADINDSLFAGLDLRWRLISAKRTYADAVTGGTDTVNSGNGLIIAAKIGYKFGL